MNDDHDLNKAEQSCSRSLERVDAALSHLKSAKSWGTFDIFGGGFLTGYFKTNKIQKAEKEIEQLHAELRKLGQISDEIRYALDGFEALSNLQKTLDLGLDDVYTNWKNQEQIKRNINLLEELQENLIELAGRLIFKNTL